MIDTHTHTHTCGSDDAVFAVSSLFLERERERERIVVFLNAIDLNNNHDRHTHTHTHVVLTTPFRRFITFLRERERERESFGLNCLQRKKVLHIVIVYIYTHCVSVREGVRKESGLPFRRVLETWR